jgi:glycosyltransferase involved in cell wall biosynthesis
VEQWELLLVDNASKEPLTFKKEEISWHPRARVIREEELGLTSARMRGIREAAADLLVFVDDDNVLDLDYLSKIFKIGHEWPRLGVWGAGSIVPEFEVRPAQYLQKLVGCLALREVDTCRWTNVISCEGAMPWGAGQCIRAEVAKAYLEHVEKSSIRITDRRGMELASGGDLEINYVGCSIGFGVGIFPELKVLHLIPANRVEEDYLVRIFEGNCIALMLLHFKWLRVIPNSPFAGIGCLRIVRYLIQKRGVYRRWYLAGLRATFRARRVIFANEVSQPSIQYDSRTV